MYELFFSFGWVKDTFKPIEICWNKQVSGRLHQGDIDILTAATSLESTKRLKGSRFSGFQYFSLEVLLLDDNILKGSIPS